MLFDQLGNLLAKFQNHKILDVIFHPRLIFTQHIIYIAERCSSWPLIMKALPGTLRDRSRMHALCHCSSSHRISHALCCHVWFPFELQRLQNTCHLASSVSHLHHYSLFTLSRLITLCALLLIIYFTSYCSPTAWASGRERYCQVEFPLFSSFAYISHFLPWNRLLGLFLSMGTVAITQH